MNRRERRAQWAAQHRQETIIGHQSSRQIYDARLLQTESLSGEVQHQSSQSISVRIDELVLHGFAPTDRYRIGDAMQQELTRLFVEGGIPRQLDHSFETARIDAGSFQMAQGTRAEAVGAKIAHAVYGGPKR